MSTKEKILQTSLKLFLKKGYDKVSMNDIVKACGISKGGVYHHFNSKNEIYENVISKFYFSKVNKYKIYLEDSTLSAIEKIKKITDHTLYSVKNIIDSIGPKTEGKYLFLLLAENIDRPDFLERELQSSLELKNSLTVAFQQGIEMNEFKISTDVKLCTDQIVLWINGSLQDLLFRDIDAIILRFQNIRSHFLMSIVQ